MSREVRRVPLDFDAELGKVWPGYLMPERLRSDPCPDCKSGYSEHAQNLFDLWYGYIPFSPESNGSTPLAADSPGVWAFATRNVEHAPEYYGTGDIAIRREAQRLVDLFNSQWSHHLNQDDVDALIAADRLWDFTHTCTREDGWQRIEPPVSPTAEQVNDWSIRGFGHDSLNAGYVIEARCKREGMPHTCVTCGGSASRESYEGQAAEADAWEPTEPPEGEGWQLWETVSEGSPMSPVFDTADGLAGWMSDPERGDTWVPFSTAQEFIKAGWAPSAMGSPETGWIPGVEAVGFWTGGSDE